ncbi:MAG: 50S ribosomal protein L18 [Candidatus Woesearchaeota archaeon]
MTRKTIKTIPYRRKQEGKTNYKKRLRLVQSQKPRLVIRQSLKNMLVQVISFDPVGDKVLAEAKSGELKNHGWKGTLGNIPAAYLTGYMTGMKCKKAGLKDLVVDLGFRTPTKGSRIFAVIKGIRDAGIDINCNEEKFPSDDRINGKHIEAYAENLSTKERDPSQISKMIDQVKQKVSNIK